MIKRDQCPHCFKKIEHELWVNRTGCPYCGKRIIMEVEEDSEEVSFYADFPKVPPRLDWFVMPFLAVLALPLPLLRWVLGGFDGAVFDAAFFALHAAVCAVAGGLLGYVYYRLNRIWVNDDRRRALLRWCFPVFLLLGAALYLTG